MGLLCCWVAMANAQEAVTDEELRKYAIAMDSIDDMRKSLIEDIAELVKSNGKITATRYNELSKVLQDEARLAEAKATPEEIEAIREIIKVRDAGSAKISETFQALAKDFVGVATYNKVRKALTADTEVKARYEKVLEGVKNDSE